jgi:hypothetical protein
VAWGGAGLAAVLLGLAPDLTTAVIFGGLTWCGVTYGNVLWFPMMQRYVPADMLGRASAVDWTLSLALVPARHGRRWPRRPHGTRADLARTDFPCCYLPAAEARDSRAGQETSARSREEKVLAVFTGGQPL